MFKADTKLKRWYDKWNRAYFDGTLPEAEVGWEDQLPDKRHGQTMVFEDEETSLDCASFKEWVELVLMHELAHVKLYPYTWHGQRFKDEIRRLVMRGAYDTIL